MELSTADGTNLYALLITSELGGIFNKNLCDLGSSQMLRSVGHYLTTDVSGYPVGPFFKVERWDR